MIDNKTGYHWDVIVVGTGIGGGTVGRALAEKGLCVLFVEKGPAGFRAEETPLDLGLEDPIARQIRGFWPQRMEAKLGSTTSSFFAPLGSGVGGSSVFYAATLERPEPHDLDDSNARPHPAGGWPVNYAEMSPYIEQAEAIYHISGDPDPLSEHAADGLLPPKALNPGEVAMMDRMRRDGLHPYHLHAAIRRLDGCKSCLGFKCPKPCKMDGRSAGVEPAVATGRAHVLDKCEVKRIHGDAGSVSHLEAVHDGKAVTLRARTFILAAGALASPRLMLASASEDWPQGCGNENGLVGRHLMFHLDEKLALWPSKSSPAFDGPSRAIGFRDLYFVNGERFGMVQAMGMTAKQGEILNFLRMSLDQSRFRHLRLLKQFARIPALLAERFLGEAQLFVAMMEDPPLPDNRVTWTEGDGDLIRVEYTVRPDVEARRKRFRKLVRQAFKGHRFMFLTHWPVLNFGHPCGTLRFGRDPATSVLDKDCRVHGLSNLYVTDASFMPTSMGVNPSLTIAANALRVADRVCQNMGQK
jgi:choline dehydrogenase-like flavoprotein